MGQGGGPYQAGVGTMPNPGAASPQSRVSLFPGGPVPPGGGGPMAPMGAANPLSGILGLFQGMMGVGMEKPQSAVKQQAENMFGFGRALVETAEDAYNMRQSLLNKVFQKKVV